MGFFRFYKAARVLLLTMSIILTACGDKNHISSQVIIGSNRSDIEKILFESEGMCASTRHNSEKPPFVHGYRLSNKWNANNYYIDYHKIITPTDTGFENLRILYSPENKVLEVHSNYIGGKTAPKFFAESCL